MLFCKYTNKQEQYKIKIEKTATHCRIAVIFVLFVNLKTSFILLNRYALGKVAGPVNILALADGYVIGQKLQGNAGNEGLEAF